MCNLMEVMAPIRNEKEEARYGVRRKSRNWGPDALTQREIDNFCKVKGYRS
jgi:hypothetical protein